MKYVNMIGRELASPAARKLELALFRVVAAGVAAKVGFDLHGWLGS